MRVADRAGAASSRIEADEDLAGVSPGGTMTTLRASSVPATRVARVGHALPAAALLGAGPAISPHAQTTATPPGGRLMVCDTTRGRTGLPAEWGIYYLSAASAHTPQT